MENNHNHSLYETAKYSAASLLPQVAVVLLEFLGMLVLTKGNPSGELIKITFCISIVSVAWLEWRRIVFFDTSKYVSTTNRKSQLRLLKDNIRNEEMVYISSASRRLRDIRSTNRPSIDPVPEVPEGYEGVLQRDFSTIDTVEIAVYFLYQYLPNTQYLDHLFTLVYQQYPRWTELELLKYLLGRIEVTRRSQPDWTDHDLYIAVLTTLS